MKTNRLLVLFEGNLRPQDIFPSENAYDDSLWARWHERIQKGYEAENAVINKHVQWIESKLTPEQKKSDSDYLNDYVGYDAWENYTITNNMYAGLIISLWSEMEKFLISLVKVCEATKKSTHANERITSNKFGERVVKYLRNEWNISIDKLSNYPIVNAIRILNNCLKHDGGIYVDGSKSHEIINPELIKEWNCFTKRFTDRNEIDYTKLPIRKLVIACNLFFQSILSAVRNNLEGLEYEI